jgi:hypothetical protein
LTYVSTEEEGGLRNGEESFIIELTPWTSQSLETLNNSHSRGEQMFFLETAFRAGFTVVVHRSNKNVKAAISNSKFTLRPFFLFF